MKRRPYERRWRRCPKKVWLCLPTVCTEETLDMLAKLAAEQAEHVEGLVLGSVGQLGHDWPLPVAAGPGIPVMNRRAMAVLLEAGCQFVTASPELSGRETAALVRGNAPALIWAWGRVRLMLLHHCPARVYLDCKAVTHPAVCATSTRPTRWRDRR